MASLHFTCPDVYREFMEGNFSYLKTKSSFSRMGLDQLHEQNNKYIKGVSGATSLVNQQDETALIRWELCGPELSRLLPKFEESNEIDREEKTQKHHEDNLGFQNDFFDDVDKVIKNFVCNPFESQSLTVVNKTGVVFDDNIFLNISKLGSIGSSQLHEFIQQRLILSKIFIKEKIPKNHFILLGDETNKKRCSPVDPRLNLTFFTKLRSAIMYRRNLAKRLFSEELFGTAQCLSVDKKTLYHGNKADILRKFKKVPFPEIYPSSALIVELSAILRFEFKAATFDEFSEKVYEYIIEVGKHYDRIDVICDRYFELSLKTDIRSNRGCGGEINFNDQTKFPSDSKKVS